MSAECAKTAEARSGAQVFVGNILDAPFPPESFDVITCFDVLEHLYEPRRVMARVSEWLKPGGMFYVLVPNVDSAEARVFGSYWHGLELPQTPVPLLASVSQVPCRVGGTSRSCRSKHGETLRWGPACVTYGMMFSARVAIRTNTCGLPTGGKPSMESSAKGSSHDGPACSPCFGSSRGRWRVHPRDFL